MAASTKIPASPRPSSPSLIYLDCPPSTPTSLLLVPEHTGHSCSTAPLVNSRLHPAFHPSLQHKLASHLTTSSPLSLPQCSSNVCRDPGPTANPTSTITTRRTTAKLHRPRTTTSIVTTTTNALIPLLAQITTPTVETAPCSQLKLEANPIPIIILLQSPALVTDR